MNSWIFLLFATLLKLYCLSSYPKHLRSPLSLKFSLTGKKSQVDAEENAITRLQSSFYTNEEPSKPIGYHQTTPYPIQSNGMTKVIEILRLLQYSDNQLHKILTANQFNKQLLLRRITFFQRSLHLSNSDYLPLIGIKSILFILPFPEIQQKIRFFVKTLHCSSLTLHLFLTKRTKIWLLPYEEYLLSYKFLIKEYGFSDSQIIQLIAHPFYILFDSSLRQDSFLRKEIITNFLLNLSKDFEWKENSLVGLLSSKNNNNNSSDEKKLFNFQKICIRNPKLLLIPVKELISSILAIVEGLQLQNAEEIYKLIRISSFLLNYQDHALMKFRCIAAMQFLMNGKYIVIGKRKIAHERIDSALKESVQGSEERENEHSRFVEEICSVLPLNETILPLLPNTTESEEQFLDSYLKNLLPNSTPLLTDSQFTYLEFVNESIHSALQTLTLDSQVNEELIDFHDLSALSRKNESSSIQQILQETRIYFFRTIEKISLSYDEAVKVALRSNIIANNMKMNCEKLGLLSMILALDPIELQRIICTEPLIINCNFEKTIFPKFSLLAQAARTFLQRTEKNHLEEEESQILSIDRNESILFDNYRRQPVRKLVRECILGNPRILTMSLLRYQTRITLFENNPHLNDNWKKLSAIIYAAKLEA